jgi:hypothetical protein
MAINEGYLLELHFYKTLQREGFPMFDLKKPCKDCPFLKNSPMREVLHSDRLPQIVSDLLSDDHKVFTCHKTINYKERVDEVENETFYPQPGNQMCMGSMIFLQKMGRPHISQRVAYAIGLLNHKDLENQFDLVIDAEDLCVNKKGATQA